MLSWLATNSLYAAILLSIADSTVGDESVIPESDVEPSPIVGAANRVSGVSDAPSETVCYASDDDTTAASNSRRDVTGSAKPLITIAATQAYQLDSEDAETGRTSIV